MGATSRLRASPSTPWEKFIALADTDRRELIDGALVETEMPTKLHEQIVCAMVFFFHAWVRQHGGYAFASGYKVRVDSQHGFLPDAQLYHPNNRADLAEQGCVRGAPDVVLEVLSEGSVQYDKKTKLLGYAKIGVAEYWIASQNEPAIERLVLRRGKYVVEQVLLPGDILRTSRFAGLAIPIGEIYPKPSKKR